MNNLPYILTFLDKELNTIPYQIWISNKEGQKLLYNSHDNYQPITIDHFDTNNIEEKYHIEHHNNSINVSFFYPEHYHIYLCLLNRALPLTADKLNILYHLFFNIYSEEAIQIRDTELETLSENIRSVNSTLNLDDVLKKIMNNALKVISSADTGFLQLFDPKTEYLIPRAVVGFDSTIYKMKIKIGEGVTGKVYEDGIPKIFNSTDKDLYGPSGYVVSEKNLMYFLSSSNQKQIKGAIFVPVSISGTRIGVLVVHQVQKKQALTKRDLKLLQVFADQAAIAIHNGQLYTELNVRLDEATKLSRNLQQKNDLLLKRNEIHNTLIRISNENTGIKSIILEIKRMMDHHVGFFDFFREEFTWSSPNQRDLFSNEEISHIFLKRSSPVYIDIATRNSTISLFLYPITNRNTFLGCIIVPLTRPLTELEIITIELGGSVLALELVKYQARTDIYYKKTHDYFTDLLQMNKPDLLLKKSEEFGINLLNSLFVVVIEITKHDDIQLQEVHVNQIVSRIKRTLPHINKLVYGFQNKITILGSISNVTIIAQIMDNIHSIISEWKLNMDYPIMAGIGGLYKGIENISKSYQEAIKTLNYLSDQKRDGVMRYEEIGINRLFLNQHPNEIQKFISEVFTPLQSKNGEKYDLEQTLIVYFANNRSATLTAEKLHVHINTLYKRLKKIEKLTNLCFDNPEESLKIQIACHLKETFNF